MIGRSPRMAAPRPTVRQRKEAYVTSMLVALIAAECLVLLLVRVPLRTDDSRVGWQVIRTDEVIALEEVRFEDGLSAAPGIVIPDLPPVVVPPADQPEAPTEGDGSTGEDPEEGVEETAPRNRVQRLERLVLAAAETMPEIRGGLGAYYINIEYPQPAIDAGIQGRLVLDFVVEPDGHASEIQVYQPLHPLLDSSAVRALRKTVFMPGRSGGEAVAVRMRLPVLFQIMGSAKSDSLGSGRR